MMDIKKSVQKVIKQCTDLLQKLEEDEDIDESSNDIEMFDEIIEDSKNISTQLKSKRSKSKHNGNKSSGDDSRPASIKLVPIEKLIEKPTSTVLDKTCIELSDSDNEMLVQSTKPKSSDSDETSKVSILKSVLTPSNESTSKMHTDKSTSTAKNRSCRVNIKRTDLNKLATLRGLKFIHHESPTIESSKTVRFIFLKQNYKCWRLIRDLFTEKHSFR